MYRGNGIFAQDCNGIPEQSGQKEPCRREGLSKRLTAGIQRIYRKTLCSPQKFKIGEKMYPIPPWMYDRIKELAVRYRVSPYEICRVMGIHPAMFRLTECDNHDFVNASDQNKIKDDLACRVKILEELFEGHPALSDFEARMDNVICDELKKQIVNPSNNVLFAWLDILGFKRTVNCNPIDKVKSMIDGLLRRYEKVFDDGRFIAGSKIDYSYDFNFRVLSDTIIIWSNSTHPRLFDYFFYGLRGLIRESIRVGIPLRGVVTIGNIFTIQQKSNLFFSNEAIYGNALINAYLLENQFDWAGCVVTPEVIREMNKISTTFQHCSCQGNIIEHYFKCEPLLIWCQLPHKMAELSGAALNWCYPLSDEDKLPEGDIIHAFNEHETPDSHLSNKINKTLSFFKAARNINRDVLFR